MDAQSEQHPNLPGTLQRKSRLSGWGVVSWYDSARPRADFQLKTRGFVISWEGGCTNKCCRTIHTIFNHGGTGHMYLSLYSKSAIWSRLKCSCLLQEGEMNKNSGHKSTIIIHMDIITRIITHSMIAISWQLRLKVDTLDSANIG